MVLDPTLSHFPAGERPLPLGQQDLFLFPMVSSASSSSSCPWTAVRAPLPSPMVGDTRSTMVDDMRSTMPTSRASFLAAPLPSPIVPRSTHIPSSLTGTMGCRLPTPSGDFLSYPGGFLLYPTTPAASSPTPVATGRACTSVRALHPRCADTQAPHP